jgi:hypothetical protein
MVLFLIHVTSSHLSGNTVVIVTVYVLDRQHSKCVYMLHPIISRHNECYDVVHDSCHITFLDEYGDQCCRYNELVPITE